MKTLLIIAGVAVGGYVVYRFVKIPGLPGSGAGGGTFPGTPSAGQLQTANQADGWTALTQLAKVSPDVIRAAGDAFGGGDDNYGGNDWDPYYNPSPYDTYA